jgi:hypothetical protein
MRGAFGVLLFAAWAGGVQYLVCVAIALWWLRGRHIASYWYVACFAPLVFGVVVSISLAGIMILSTSRPILVEEVAAGALALGLAVIAIGYLYVLLAAAGYLFLDAVGAFTEVPPNLRLQRPASHET